MLILALLFLNQSVVAQELPSDALWEALRDDNIEAVVRELDAGISPDTADKARTVLCYAIRRNSIEIVKTLLEHGANPNLAEPITAYTPLMVAAKHFQPAAVELLLQYEANVNQTSVFGRTPLNMAALHNSLEVGHILLTQTNVDVNARGKLCSLAVASRQGNLDFVKLILAEAKYPPTKKCLASAKEMAEYNKHLDVLEVLNPL